MTSEHEGRMVPAEALGDALEGLRDMVDYVPEYFREKWEHSDYIDRAEAALADAVTVPTPTPSSDDAGWRPMFPTADDIRNAHRRVREYEARSRGEAFTPCPCARCGGGHSGSQRTEGARE